MDVKTHETSWPQKVDVAEVLQILSRWAQAAEPWWYEIPGRPNLGCYGTGYDTWGVQTNQKYVGAMAALGVLGPEYGIDEELCRLCIERALAGLRYSLASHITGDFDRTDGSRWGRTWISELGVERMMYGVHLLGPHLTDDDRQALRRVLTDEANWLYTKYPTDDPSVVPATMWNHEGGNRPEANIWNGAALWRAAELYPDDNRTELWRHKAHRFLMNGVSIPADAEDDTIVAGRPVKEWHCGPNFFPRYALDHHGYLNIGYMIICVSNAAMLHLDMKTQGRQLPDPLYHHQQELWQVVRKMICTDGRLCRIGGATRVRYSYCQEYVVPSLLFAADVFGEPCANYLINQILQNLVHKEMAADGSFYGRRLRHMISYSMHYFTRLESDRACVLGMLAAYAHQLRQPAKQKEAAPADITQAETERSLTGAWADEDHGAVLHRCPTRLASFAWRAAEHAQGMALPPNASDLADWQHNLAGAIHLQEEPDETRRRRKFTRCTIEQFDGGFATSGCVFEGANLYQKEGWHLNADLPHQIVFAALPDAHTVVGLQFCRASKRLMVRSFSGLHYNLPNDIFNDYRRRIITPAKGFKLTSPAAKDENLRLGCRWMNVDGKLGVVGIYGADEFTISRSQSRRGGQYNSLFVEEICWPLVDDFAPYEAGAVILDAGWAVLTSTDSAVTRQAAESAKSIELPEYNDVRAVRVTGRDGRDYVVAANFGEVCVKLSAEQLLKDTDAEDLVTGRVVKAEDRVDVEAGQCRVFGGFVITV